jgi:hypothetical protein
MKIRKSKDRQHIGQTDKQRSTKHTHKTIETRTPLKPVVNSGAPEVFLGAIKPMPVNRIVRIS